MGTHSNSWEIDFSQVDSLVEKMLQIPNRTEAVMNDVIHNYGIQMVIEDIQPDIPISSWKNRVRQKKHARNISNPQTSTKYNLVFTVKPKPKYSYLKFPDLAIGNSSKNSPAHFMRNGLSKAAPKILDRLNRRLDEEINETLGGN